MKIEGRLSKSGKILNNNLRKILIGNARKIVELKGDCANILCIECPLVLSLVYINYQCESKYALNLAKKILANNKE